MLAYLARRALTLLPILLFMSIIVFALIRLIPGDPIDVMYGGEGMDEVRRAALARELGLDQPVIIQYGRWLVRAIQGDLGNSYRAGMPVIQLIGQRLPATLWLCLNAMILSLVIALPLGLLAAVTLILHKMGRALFCPCKIAGLLFRPCKIAGVLLPESSQTVQQIGSVRRRSQQFHR